ncbi:MAG TPA: hypothetical protein VH369_15700 [Bryobacteraceae bacterium]|jgi:hypothetical protein
MFKAAILSAVCAACALCQVRTEGAKPVISVRTGEAGFAVAGVTGAMMGPAGKIAGAPYSADVVTQHVQTLADGNRIEQTTNGSVARDSQGRVRRDEALPALAGSNGEAPHLIMIDDPVAQVHWTLDAQTKTATKMPMPPMPPTPPMPPLPPGKPGAVFDLGMPAPPVPMVPGIKTYFATTSIAPAISFSTRADSKEASKADLGLQTVEGVPAQGTRVTRTIEAGQMGNSLPIVITTETWFSPDLKVLISSKSSDPRIGETTYKLTNIQRAEPDPSLFQVPADYTIRDQPQNMFFLAPPKKEE